MYAFSGITIDPSAEKILFLIVGGLLGFASPQMLASLAAYKETREINTIECKNGGDM
jgi:hypothetical protein